MGKIIQPITAQLEIVDRLIKQAEAAVENRPAGEDILIVAVKNNYTEWYLKQNGKGRRYMKKKEEPLARMLAQAAYAKGFLKTAQMVWESLRKLQASGLQRSAACMYEALAAPFEELSPARKALVEPYVLPEKEFVPAWENAAYEGLPFAEDDPEIFTERGVRVRSKSEKMIADKLDILGIPYRYEYPVYIRGLGIIHSDFTLLDPAERTKVVFEHFGLMEDPAYLRNALRKIDLFERNGYFLGDTFLCTFESREHVLDMKHFEQMIRERFSK